MGQGATAQIIQSTGTDKRIEVAIERNGEVDSIVLRQLTWTEGLGWCSQKTIRLDTEQLDELHRALAVTRHRINRDRADAGCFESAQVIRLPSLT